jgi:hypothetical protein
MLRTYLEVGNAHTLKLIHKDTEGEGGRENVHIRYDRYLDKSQ